MATDPAHYARYVIERFGGVDGLSLRRGEPLPAPGRGQVRLRVEASCVQFTDTIVRRGRYPDAGKPPITPSWFREDLTQLFELLARGELKVRIARRIGFEELPAAHTELERGGVSGKIVLVP